MVSFGGIITAMVTPFDEEGRVAEDGCVRLMRHLTESGTQAIVLCATTGEGSTLTDDEKCAIWRLGVQEAGVPIIAATGTNDTAHSVELTERATEIGADAVLAVCPYYNKPNPRGILAHYEALAAATDKPIVVYNIPSRCVTDIGNDLLRQLAAIDNVRAVKQARFTDLEPIDGLDVLAGNDEMLAPILDMGGTGGILVASHVVGERMRQMVDEPHARWQIHESLGELFKALTVTSNPIPIKAALNLLGFGVGGLRLPLVSADDSELAQIQRALEANGLLSTV